MLAAEMFDGSGQVVSRRQIDEAQSDPLIGMSLMEGYELTIQAIKNGDVMLTKLPAG